MTKINRCFLAVALLAALFAAGPVHAADPEAEIEKLVGKPLAESFKAQYGVVNDPTITHWVDGIGHDVAAQSPRQDIPYAFIIGDTDIVNAFSLPGGTIFVTRGLLDSVDDDDELACVLAHEVGHDYHYHAAKLLAAQTAFSLLDNDVIKPSGEGAQTAVLVADVLSLLSLSRHNESEADASGVDFSSRADYDPRGLIEFFTQIEDPGKHRSGGIGDLLDTHPSTADRIRRVNARIAKTISDADWKRIGDRLKSLGLYGRAADVFAIGGDSGDRLDAQSLADALPIPNSISSAAPTFRPDDFARFRVSLDASRHGLNRAYDSDRLNATLQQLLAVSVTNRDFGMLLLATQAFATESRAQEVEAEEAVVTRTAPTIWHGLSGPGSQLDGSQARNEALAAAAGLSAATLSLSKAIAPLRTAETTLTAAILDLDISAFGVGIKQDRTAHYGALEAALLLAYHSLDRAQHFANDARSQLDRAHLRLLVTQLDSFPVCNTYTMIAARRLNISPDILEQIMQSNSIGFGSAAVLTAVSIEAKKDPSTVHGPTIAGSSYVDLAVTSGASVGSIELILRLIERDFVASHTISKTIGIIP